MVPSSSIPQVSSSKGHFDANVLGAGLAGLTAAASLAREEAQILVYEQADKVGGLFNSFWRNGYLLDGGIKVVETSGEKDFARPNPNIYLSKCVGTKLNLILMPFA